MPNSDNGQSNQPRVRKKANPAGTIGFNSSALIEPRFVNNFSNSRYGTNGLICSGIAVVVIIFHVILLNAFQTAPRLEGSASVEVPRYITVLSIIALLLVLGAFLSCIMGLREKGKKKTHAIIGIVLSSLVGFGVISIMISNYNVEQQRLEKIEKAREAYRKQFRK